MAPMFSSFGCNLSRCSVSCDLAISISSISSSPGLSKACYYLRVSSRLLHCVCSPCFLLLPFEYFHIIVCRLNRVTLNIT